MNEKAILENVVGLLELYLNGKISAHDFINKYDEVITSNEFPWDSENPKIQQLDQFQDELSLFVENPEWRKEHQSFYGENELKEKVTEFLIYLKT